MGCTPFVIFLLAGLCLAFGQEHNETLPEEKQSTNATSRRGRRIQEIIELPPLGKKTKRQIIKIPPSVSKVKLVQPPLSLRHNRAPQQFNRFPPNFRSGVPWRPSIKQLQTDSDFDPEYFKKVKRTLPKPYVQEVSPEEFYRDEDYDYEDRKKQEKKHRRAHKVVKIKRKRPRPNVLGEYLAKYEGDNFSGTDEGFFESSKLQHDENKSYGFDPAGSSFYAQQVPPPNLFPENVFPGEKYSTGMNVKKLPTKGRQIQSLFSQQYTTHNPQVAKNFGLGEIVQVSGLQYKGKGSIVDAVPYDMPKLEKYSQQVAAASDQVGTSLPVGTPGIQVIQPPQFRDVTVSRPTHPSRLMSSPQQKEEISTSQKATIRDILEQDCPAFESRGYCDSPPRYPMQQIKKMIKKCASLMEAMNTQPFDEPQDIYAFDRSDEVEDRGNTSLSQNTEPEKTSTWSRSSTTGLTACISDLELIEPGYAKEVNSGRWFVIVQHPDTTIQRIATDTCRNPGKSCGGLSEMKCGKIGNLPVKTTRCIQRHTYQRLISWDPEAPDDCPQMRVFRFPSACVCHLGVL